MELLQVNNVQQLVEELYRTKDPGAAKQIQEQLQIIQRQPQAWQLASELLSLPSEQCRFFGAHTFQVKISRDWNTLPEDQVDWLRQELITWIVRLCPGPLFIITKLCVAVISFAFHTVPDHWQHFVSQTINALLRGAQGYGIPEHTVRYTILEFLSLVPEEISNAEILGGKKPRILQELKDSIPLVIMTLSSILIANDSSLTDATLQQKALKCLTSWIQYGVPLEDAYPLIQQSMMFLAREDMLESATEVLLEAMQQPSWSRYDSLRNDLLNCFVSDWMRGTFSRCIEEDDEELGRSLAKLFTTFGEAYTDFVACQLADKSIRTLLDMIMCLTGFPGHFPADQEVSEIPLNFWYVLQETLFDNGIVPVQQATGISIITDGDDDVSLEQRDPDRKLWQRQCGETALILYRQLVQVLRQKAAFPEDTVWDSWTKDVKDKFRICRRDLGDTLINPYYILRDEMLSILLDHASDVLNRWNTIHLPAQELEATLFCLKSISEEIPAEENVHIPRFFGQEVLGRLPTEGGMRLQNTALLLMGSLAEWLKGHPDYLPGVMNYIVPCLSMPKLAPAASSAFSEICDACRESLAGELDNLMHVYGAMANSFIPPSIMQKVVESVADVIQVLPSDRAIAPLMTLTGDIIQGVGNALNTVQVDPKSARETVLTQLQYLSACCRGIQSPNDDYQSLAARNSVYDAFASGQLAAMYVNVDGFNQITSAIRESVERIAAIWNNDEQVMKGLSHFVESGIRSTSPLLALPFSDLITLVTASYRNAPFACWLHTATFIVTVYGGQESNHAQLRDFLGALTEKTLAFINKTEDMEQYPDVVDSYFDLLSGTIRRCPSVFFQLPHEMLNTIFCFAIAGMGLQERLALRASLNFMDYKEGSELADIAHSMIMSLGMRILEQLLAGIGGRVPRSFSGPLVDVLYKLTGRYIEACRHWLQGLLAIEGFPSTLVNQADKEAFMKAILGTRSLKKFKQATHEFSIKCRGLANTAYGSVA